jgi:hypothetical protein
MAKRYIILEVDDWCEAFVIDGEEKKSIYAGHNPEEGYMSICEDSNIVVTTTYLDGELTKEIEETGEIGLDILEKYLTKTK